MSSHKRRSLTRPSVRHRIGARLARTPFVAAALQYGGTHSLLRGSQLAKLRYVRLGIMCIIMSLFAVNMSWAGEGALAGGIPLAAWHEKKVARLERLSMRRARSSLQMKHGRTAARVVNVFNTWTREWMALAPGELVAPEQAARFFRCHFTGEQTAIDARLVAALQAAARHFRKDRINIVSGFRHPKYNLMLRKKGRNVARNSEHQQGDAVDFRVPGVGLHALQSWVYRQRLGGAGRYDTSKFVHMDTGGRRLWRGD